MVDRTFYEAEESHALIIGYSIGERPLPSVKDDVKLVEAFATKHNFTSTTVLLDETATTEAVDDFFTDHAKRCKDSGKSNSNKKYFLMVYYSGHGRNFYGT